MMTKEERSAYYRQWRIKNKEWLTRKRRKRDGVKTPRFSWTGRVEELRLMYTNKEEYSTADIARHFGVSKRSVHCAALFYKIKRA